MLPRLAALFTDETDRALFVARLAPVYPRLHTLLHTLYGTRADFAEQIAAICATAARGLAARPQPLRALDASRPPDWFAHQRMVGGMCYVDRYATNLAGLRECIPYFRELGLTYLHLMPLFRAPLGENDGGYAVSSFREVRPDLGTMAEFADIAAELRANGISPVLDFVLNHTADDHEWALRAKAGNPVYQDFYLTFPDRTLPDAYGATLREIFPEQAPGNFTFVPEMARWVWTTFHQYQWDLHYANPVVFDAMLGELLFLANQGVEVLRMDAVAFIWKEVGTSSENRPEAHLIIEALNLLACVAAPSLIFKSEAIVHPDEVVKYIGQECEISYNPLLMVLLWQAMAT
ncbi:MAG: amylosucrase, partial [Ktedonobacterales bacterium]|nr:amylosucrase [Ktedonobacterales bacterium]